jgi:hypothetical protein
VGQSPAGKNVSTEVEDSVLLRYQPTSIEDTADWEEFIRFEINYRLF